MNVESIFAGIVCLVIAWALWTYLPQPLGVVGGLIFGLLGIYFLFLGVTAGEDIGNHSSNAALFRSSWGAILRSSWG